MKNLVAVAIIMSILVCSDVHAQSRLRQVKTNPVIQHPASEEAIASFVAFFEYVKKSRPDIVDDKLAQARWLSESFRASMVESNSAWVEYLRKHPDDKPEGPSNSSFTGVWNHPTNYSIVSGRQYDYRDTKNPLALRTMIDVLYVWGNEDDISNQYPGVRNLRTFIFIREDGVWKLDDVYVFNDEYTSSKSLRQYFRTDRPE